MMAVKHILPHWIHETAQVYAWVLSVSGTEKKKRKTMNDMNDEEDEYG
jgi:hypothetical protein